MANSCVYRWDIPLSRFTLANSKEKEILEKCGVQVNDATQIATVYITLYDICNGNVFSSYTFKESLKTLCTTINVSKIQEELKIILSKIFAVIVDYMSKHKPIVYYNFVVSDKQTGDTVPQDFLKSITKLIIGVVKDNHMTYEYTPYTSEKITTNSNTNSHKYTHNFSKPNLNNSYSSLNSIRTVEKFVKYKDTNWVIKYTISMNSDETYKHMLEIFEHNDCENKTSIIINTDSHFIKSLDQRIKSAINKLNDNLWTIDRFEKWDGELDE